MIVPPHNPDRAIKAQVQLDKATQILQQDAEQTRLDNEYFAASVGKYTPTINTPMNGANR